MGDIEVRFKRFDWDRGGYAAVLCSGGVQSLVASAADRVAASANAMMPDNAYELPDHEVKEFQGRLATGRVVRTKTDAARRASAKGNVLKKALDSTGGA